MSEYIPLNEIYLKNFYDISNRTENFSKRKLNEEYANISSIVSTSSFTYDEPMTLEYPYIINNNNVECYLYYIDMIDRNFQFAVLAARDWGEIEEIKLLKKVSEINNEQEEEYETIKIIKDKKKLIPCDVFEKFFFFFQHLLADLYLIARKNIENNLFNFQEAIFEKLGKKNFTVVPAWKLNNRHEIDFNCISSFNSFKKDELKFVSTLLDKIRECGFDLNQQKFKNYVEDNIFSSVYSNRINYYIVDYIAKPMEEKGIKYLEMLLKYFNNKKTLEDLLFLFNLTREQAETITINQLLYEHEIKENVDSIYFFRNLDMKYNLKTDRSLPIMILNYINHINCFDFINPKNFLNMHNSAKKTNLELSSPNVHLLSSQHLIQYPLSMPSYNNYCAIPSIFILLERYLIANEMKMMMRIQANTMDIIQATSTPCYDINFNYEVLEVVGDSVLKYIASCFLYKKYTNENEDFLTKIRSMYIKNKFLSKIAFKNFVHFFLKTHKKNVNQWRTPFMKDYSKNSLINHTIAAKNLADTLEALLGALFIYTYEFKNVMEGLISFEIPITYLIMNSPLILCENYFSIMETAYFRINLALNEEMNYKDLRSCIENFHFPKLIKNKSFMSENIKKKSKRCCGSAFKMIFSIFERIPDSFNYIHWRNSRILKSLRHLEKNILNYSFKNKRLLITALNMEKRPADPIFVDDYQSLEFLGDALQEIFVVGNSYKLFREKKLNLVPEIMQRLKITLLSNSFMARMVVLLGLYKFMFNVGEETQTEINRFVKRVKFEKSFKNFVRHEICIPKSLSDIWESLSAAVLIDGGWKAFNTVFGTILAPYIKFFCTYYHKIETNIVSKLKNNCQEKWQKIIEFKMEYKEDERLFVHSVFLGNDLICQGKGTSNKISRERAAMKACKMLKLI